MIVIGLVVPYVRDVRVEATPRSTSVASGTNFSGTSLFGTSPLSASSTTSTIASALGGSSSVRTGSSSGAGNSPAAGTGTTATAPAVTGVTSTQIKIGIGLIDVGQAAQFGYNFDIGNEQARYQALIDNINNAGGINGRKIVPYYDTFNAVDPTASSQAACIDWTQTQKVFAVLVEFEFPTAAEVCVLQTGTPFITGQGTDSAYYRNGLFFTLMPSDDRTLEDEANFLSTTGQLNGKVIGVVSGDGSDELAVDNTLIPALKQLGYGVKDVEVIPSSTSAVQQIPIAISNLKAAGVNFVIMAAAVILAGPFAQSASQAGYNPQYGISDFNNMVNSQTAGYFPSSFNGTIALSQTRFAEYAAGAQFTPTDQACLNIEHPVDPTVLPASNAAFPVAMGDCGIFNLFVDGAKAAGPALTLGSWVGAMGTLGSFPIPGNQNGSFTSSKHDGIDFEQQVQWQSSCSCWQLLNGLNTPTRALQ